MGQTLLLRRADLLQLVEPLPDEQQRTRRSPSSTLKALEREHHAELAALLNAVKGVGKATPSTRRAEVREPGESSRREVSAPAAVAPIRRDPGTTRGKRAILRGRAAVREGLFRAALGALRQHRVIKAFHQRRLAAGEPGKLALTACARPLLTILNAMARSGKPFNAALHSA